MKKTMLLASAAIFSIGFLAAHASAGVLQPAEIPVIHLAQATAPSNPAAAGATETKGETVEQRISEPSQCVENHA